jgi:hypothetical protein
MQTSVVPSEDDIYNDVGSSPDPIEPAEDELQSIEDESFLKIDQIEAYLQSIPDPALDCQSTTQSHIPTPTPSSSVPVTETSALFLKRKRKSITPYRGTGQKDKALWKHARQRLPKEHIQDDHGHEIFHCSSCQW